jgi:hypothetical protein
MLRPKKKFVVASGVVAGMMATGIAWAAWTASGTGNGYAKASTAQVLTTSDASASTTAQLYPGGSGDVKVTVNNPNPYAVSITSITDSGPITADKAGCTVTGVSFADQSGPYALAANGPTTLTLTGAASMSNASDNACQGAVFTIPVTLAGASA